MHSQSAELIQLKWLRLWWCRCGHRLWKLGRADWAPVIVCRTQWNSHIATPYFDDNRNPSATRPVHTHGRNSSIPLQAYRPESRSRKVPSCAKRASGTALTARRHYIEHCHTRNEKPHHIKTNCTDQNSDSVSNSKRHIPSPILISAQAVVTEDECPGFEFGVDSETGKNTNFFCIPWLRRQRAWAERSTYTKGRRIRWPFYMPLLLHDHLCGDWSDM